MSILILFGKTQPVGDPNVINLKISQKFLLAGDILMLILSIYFKWLQCCPTLSVWVVDMHVNLNTDKPHLLLTQLQDIGCGRT